MKSPALLATCLLCLPLASPALDDLPPDLAGAAMPQVLTPARLKQAQVDVAASVTVIDREMIASLGARDIPELLRLVPGMMVTRVHGAEFAVNYHGTNIRDIRRLQVLVDGMSVYQPGLARILWSDLALSIDDIERIEITRGPDAAAYGANAFSAVINIITTHPQDSTDNMLRVAGGNRATIDSAGRFTGHSGDRDWRGSFWTREDSGFDYKRGYVEHRDDRRGGGFNWRSEQRFGDHDRLEWIAGIKDGYNEDAAETHDTFTRYETLPRTEVQNMHLLARWTHDLSARHSRQVQAYVQRTDIDNRFRTCLPPILLSDDLRLLHTLNPDGAFGLLDTAASNVAAVPGYIAALPTAQQQMLATNVVNTYMAFAGAGYAETCGDVNLDIDEGRFDLEVQDTLRIGDDLRLVAGGSFRRDRGASESYTGMQRFNEIWRLFGHGEYRMSNALTFNLGALLEDDLISGTNLSPRAGLNWRVGEQQSFRLVSSRATRTQDLYEEYANIAILFRNLSPVWPPPAGDSERLLFLTQRSPGTLQPEEISSRELGYFGYFEAWRVAVDVRWFHENLNKLISDPANPFNFSVDNQSFTTLQGVEFQAKHSYSPGSWAWITYAYIDNDSTHRIEGRFTALHSGSLAVAHRFASGWTGSAAWYIQKDQHYQDGFWTHDERLDLMLARDIPLGGMTLRVSANAQCQLSEEPHIFMDNNYDDRVFGYVGLRLTY